ncbi:MAG TPA: hypothetical protein PKY31_11185 [Spirochaetota bacterium]|nr:hypothetical protein [Spirochaetota bacterium]
MKINEARDKLTRLKALKSSSMFPSPPNLDAEIAAVEDEIFKLDMSALDARIAQLEVVKKQREAEYAKLKGARA